MIIKLDHDIIHTDLIILYMGWSEKEIVLTIISP